MNKFELMEAACELYQFNDGCRFYHNWEHAKHVLAAVRSMPIESEVEQTTLEIAAMWHDAIYIPGAVGDANEECSAAALLVAGRVYIDPADQLVITDAAQLIQYTSIEYHLHELPLIGTLACLLDADISSLAVGAFDKFVEQQDQIIYEHGGNPKTDRAKCAAFLNNFLTCREYIYHTDYGRERWENFARSNIIQYIARYGA